MHSGTNLPVSHWGFIVASHISGICLASGRLQATMTKSWVNTTKWQCLFSTFPLKRRVHMLARSHGSIWHRHFSDVDEQDAQYVGCSKLVAKPLNCWVVRSHLSQTPFQSVHVFFLFQIRIILTSQDACKACSFPGLPKVATSPCLSVHADFYYFFPTSMPI